MKKLLVVLLVLVMAVSLIACGNNQSIIGKWNPEGVAVEDFTEALMEITDTDLIILGASIPYEMKGDTLVIQGQSGEEVINFTLEGDTLTFSAGEETQVFIRVKDE